MARAADLRIVFVTDANEDEALVIARALVEERLAACVNLISPVRSIYRWREQIEEGRECLLMIKTSARLYAKLERRVKQLHSYEVPEVIEIPLAHGSSDYLKWIAESVASANPAAAKPRKPVRSRRPVRIG
jgi:periplasmic divalent cation tolerance protein